MTIKEHIDFEKTNVVWSWVKKSDGQFSFEKVDINNSVAGECRRLGG